MNKKLPFSNLTSLIYPELCSVEYKCRYKIPNVPDGPGTSYPFDDQIEFLSNWLHLAKQHRKQNSPYSLASMALSFYMGHIINTFSSFQEELLDFCKASNRLSMYNELNTIITGTHLNLKLRFEEVLLLENRLAESLPNESYRFRSYNAERDRIEILINSFANAFFSQAREQYLLYVEQICDILDNIGRNVSIAYPGENILDYLRRQTSLRRQYCFNN